MLNPTTMKLKLTPKGLAAAIILKHTETSTLNMAMLDELGAAIVDAERRGAEGMRERAAIFCESGEVRSQTGLRVGGGHHFGAAIRAMPLE